MSARDDFIANTVTVQWAEMCDEIDRLRKQLAEQAPLVRAGRVKASRYQGLSDEIDALRAQLARQAPTNRFSRSDPFLNELERIGYIAVHKSEVRTAAEQKVLEAARGWLTAEAAQAENRLADAVRALSVSAPVEQWCSTCGDEGVCTDCGRGITTPTGAPQCSTCNDRGMVFWRITDDEWDSADCPDCTGPAPIENGADPT